MKKNIAIVSLILLAGYTLIADIGIAGKKEMIAQSDLIAFVDIQELISTNKTESYSDLIATAYVGEVLKGDARGELKFRIPRSFPCAAFDVSTGEHLVFLEKNEKGEYAGVNWYMSYVYLGGSTTTWYNEDGRVAESYTPDQVIRDVQKQLKKSPKKN